MNAPKPIPVSRLNANDLDRLWRRVEITPACWLWTGNLNHCGYGRHDLPVRLGSRTVRAHRLTYELLRGPIPEGLTLDHLCRVRNCVNPDHLEPVTHAENARRAARARAEEMNGMCGNGHPRTPENTYLRPDGSRSDCRRCKDEQHRRWRARQAA